MSNQSVYYSAILIIVTFVICFVSAIGIPGLACKDIKSKHCQKYGFNSTQFPNYIGQITVEHADMSLGTALSHIKFCKIKRSSAELIGCAIHFPLCINGEKLPPCKEDCKDVIRTCEITKIPGFHMALTLCDLFPLRSIGKCLSMPTRTLGIVE